jgi:hypothetical protein
VTAVAATAVAAATAHVTTPQRTQKHPNSPSSAPASPRAPADSGCGTPRRWTCADESGRASWRLSLSAATPRWAVRRARCTRRPHTCRPGIAVAVPPALQASAPCPLRPHAHTQTTWASHRASVTPVRSSASRPSLAAHTTHTHPPQNARKRHTPPAASSAASSCSSWSSSASSDQTNGGGGTASSAHVLPVASPASAFHPNTSAATCTIAERRVLRRPPTFTHITHQLSSALTPTHAQAAHTWSGSASALSSSVVVRPACATDDCEASAPPPPPPTPTPPSR